MTWYPGWDSLDSVRNWHTIFEIAGIVILALLVGAEILAFQYGHRKDELIAIAERNVETQKQAEANAIEARHKAAVEGVEKQLAEANKKVAELDRLRQPRHLTEEQKSKLTKFIKDNSTGVASFTIKANVSEPDARTFADEIASFFNATPIGWQVHVDNALTTGPDVSGMWLTIKTTTIPPAAVLLNAAFKDAGFLMKKDIQVDPGVPSSDEVWLIIGAKK